MTAKERYEALNKKGLTLGAVCSKYKINYNRMAGFMRGLPLPRKGSLGYTQAQLIAEEAGVNFDTFWG